ncbi:MAG: hypothetical protein HY318_06950, partial [Armatimonadetes bacterium]|nr:hypothetical protein [Armatimonadota bacterium]
MGNSSTQTDKEERALRESGTHSTRAGGGKTLGSLVAVVVIAFGSIASTPGHAANSVWAWGMNNAGQLGNGSATDSNVPVTVSNLSGVVAVAAGDYHSLAVK